MRSEEEIKEIIKQLDEKLTCPCCGALEPRIDYDGEMECRRCECFLDGSWLTYGAWLALKWVIGEIDTEKLADEISIEINNKQKEVK